MDDVNTVACEILHGDCRALMAAMPEQSVDAVVCDPPYGIGFMGKGWDHSVPGVEFWEAAFRVAKPGCHLMAFGGTRCFHRLMCAIEDSGWEIRDTMMWVYGSGFPKSFNAERATGQPEWAGYGTALKPAWEPIVLARKPLDGTLANNLRRWGTGALNIAEARVGSESLAAVTRGVSRIGTFDGIEGRVTGARVGRWPANLVHDGSQEVLALFPECDGLVGASKDPRGKMGYGGTKKGGVPYREGIPDSGSAARFFYCAKASRRDREEGLGAFRQFPGAAVTNRPPGSAGALASAFAGTTERPRANIHPTVKPTALMRWLVRLVVPRGGLVLDPFCGSGSTGKAAILEGRRFLGCEISEEYVKIARARCQYAQDHGTEPGNDGIPGPADVDLPEDLGIRHSPDAGNIGGELA